MIWDVFDQQKMFYRAFHIVYFGGMYCAILIIDMCFGS